MQIHRFTWKSILTVIELSDDLLPIPPQVIRAFAKKPFDPQVIRARKLSRPASCLGALYMLFEAGCVW